MGYYIGLLMLVTMCQMIESHSSDGLCNIAYEYCGFGDGGGSNQVPQATSGRIGKSGPPGPPGVVNYTVVEQKMTQFFRETEARIDRKFETSLKQMEMRLKESQAPRTCYYVRRIDAKQWNETGGLFDVFPFGVGSGTEVYCDISTDGGGWTVFQRRMDGSVNFQRGWNDYVNGFGEKDKEFWLGLETIYQMTKDGDYELRVDMEDWDGNTGFAKYSTFRIGNGDSKYNLTVGGYSGDTGDSFLFQNGRKFTTKDSDNDPDGRNCAITYKGAWWYNTCHNSNLNGLYVEGGPATYGEGIIWYHWKGHEYSLKFTEMKFRSKN